MPAMMRGGVNRNLVVSIVFFFVTCGIYGLYWIYKLNDEITALSGEPGTSGGMVILLNLVTCGIYSIYWYYKMGQKVDIIKGQRGGSSGIMFLVIRLFGLGIVNLALIQDTENHIVG